MRSAFAELYARHVLRLAKPLASCATTYHNDRLHPRTAAALRARGVPEAALRAFRPTFVTDLDVRPGDLLLAMRHGHLADLARLGLSRPGLEGELLGEVLAPDLEIADPVMDGADFDAVFAQVARAVEGLAADGGIAFGRKG